MLDVYGSLKATREAFVPRPAGSTQKPHDLDVAFPE
jgi:hypothetical protein